MVRSSSSSGNDGKCYEASRREPDFSVPMVWRDSAGKVVEFTEWLKLNHVPVSDDAVRAADAMFKAKAKR